MDYSDYVYLPPFPNVVPPSSSGRKRGRSKARAYRDICLELGCPSRTRNVYYDVCQQALDEPVQHLKDDLLRIVLNKMRMVAIEAVEEAVENYAREYHGCMHMEQLDLEQLGVKPPGTQRKRKPRAPRKRSAAASNLDNNEGPAAAKEPRKEEEGQEVKKEEEAGAVDPGSDVAPPPQEEEIILPSPPKKRPGAAKRLAASVADDWDDDGWVSN